jgi:WD40 repeat protein
MRIDRVKQIAVTHIIALLFGGLIFDQSAEGQQEAQEVRRIDVGEQGVIRVAVSPDGKCTLSGGSDGSVRLMELQTGKELKALKEHRGESYTIAFHPDGHLAISGGDDNQLLLWDLESGAKVRSFAGHTANVCGAAFSPDGKRIASGSWDKTIRVWDVVTGREVKKLVVQERHA